METLVTRAGLTVGTNICFIENSTGRNPPKKQLTMKKHINILYGMLAAVFLAVTPVAQSQIQPTGTPGSPSATTTINGEQLPAPPPKFGGVIKESALDSKPYWPARVVPPKGAPNILLIMTDHQAYGVCCTFCGCAPTPALGPIARLR